MVGGVRRGWAMVALVAVWSVLATSAVVVAAPVSAAPGEESSVPWDPTVSDAPTVAGRPVDVKGMGLDPAEAGAAPVGPIEVPEPEVAEVEVGEAPVDAGDTPVAVAEPEEPVAGDDAVDSVEVEVLDQADAKDLGASGFVFDVNRSDGGDEVAPVSLTLDYDGFAQAYGGDFASRLVVREFPACVLETPEVDACWESEVVTSSNDLADGTITVDVGADPEEPVEGDELEDPDSPSATPTTTTTVPDGSTTTTSGPAGEGIGDAVPAEPRQAPPADSSNTTSSTTTSSTTTSTTPGSSTSTTSVPAKSGAGQAPEAGTSAAAGGGSVYALTAGASGEEGNFAATSLSPGSRWEAGGSAGAATYSYPIEVPAAVVGPTPNLSLSYSSQAVDAMTPDSNNQGGIVGAGWDLSGLGFIERRYMGCGAEAPKWVGGDLCWKKDNASIVLNGVSTELVPAGGGEWKVKDDPGWKITKGQTFNGDNDGEYWLVKTPDGTTYKFGQGYEEGTNAVTNSVFRVPVFAKAAGAPCYSSTVANSWCDQAWRWNLDQIIDANGNQTSIFYDAETNHYARRGTPSAVSTYQAGGYPSRIAYSKRVSGSTAPAPTSVFFFYGGRCRAGMTGSSCPTPPTPSVASQFPDVPVDQICTSSTYCPGNYSPSFFLTKRLTSIATATQSGSTGRLVDEFKLVQTLPNPSNSTNAKLWLDEIRRTGQPAFPLFGQSDANAVAMPPVEFDGVELDNRAEGGSVSTPMFRLQNLSEELGGMIWFAYGQPGHACTHQLAANQPFTAWNTNNEYCYPVYYSPSNGSTGFAIMNKYVVTKTVLTDQTGGSPPQTTDYSYDSAPAWHHNGDDLIPDDVETWSEYRGHQKVTVTAGDSTSTYLYFRGMHGDKLTGSTTKSVSITDQDGTATVDSDWLAGRLREERQVYAGQSGARTGTVHAYGHVPVVATSGTLVARQVRETSAETRTQNPGDADIVTVAATAYDSYGLATVEHDHGDEADGGDNRCVRTTYDRTSAAVTAYRLDRPTRSILGSNCTSSYVRISDMGYDARGNLLSTKRYNDAVLDDTPTVFLETRQSYDAYGRITGVRQPRGGLTATSYTPPTNALTTSVEVTGPAPMSYTSSTTLDPYRGAPLTVTDQNGRDTTSTYDGLGRLKTVKTPLDTTSPSYTFGYDATKSHESRVRTSRRLGTSTYVNSWSLLDGFGRERETQVASPSSSGGRIVTATRYDEQGRVAAVSAPFYNSGVVGLDGLVNAAASELPNDERTTYDEFSRPVSVALRHNGSVLSETTSTYGGFDTRTTSEDGVSRRTRVNAYDETVRIEEMNGTSGSVYTTTSYAIGTAGTLARIVHDGAYTDTINYGYDNVGRRTSSSDPDAGTSSTTYDANGNVWNSTDALGQVTRTTYDELDRPIFRYDGPTSSSPVLAKWEYWEAPSANAGLAKSTISYDGANTYVSTIDSYDAGGRPTSTTQTVPASAGTGLAGTYSTTSTYDAMGNVLTTKLPAVADLPAETVTSTYSSLGLPKTTTATTTTATPPTAVPPGWTSTYVADTVYRNDGKLQSRTLGTGTNPLQRAYDYDVLTGRLSKVQAGILGGATLADDFIGYTKDGNVKETRDALGANQRECFTYDNQNRLKAAWTSGSCGASDDYTSWTPDTADPGVGPDPYEQRFSYDDRNNVTAITDGTGALPETRSFAYDNNTPHQVSSISSSVGNPTTSFTYDAGGAQLTETVGAEVSTNTWDSERRLASVVKGSDTTSSIYAADGTRLLRRSPDGSGGTTTTLYLGGHELTRSQAGAVTAKRYYGSTAMRDASGLTWLLADRQGSSTLAVKAGTATAQRQRYLPYGDARGNPDQLPTERDYLGKTKDDTTGLIQMGARYYNPKTTKFISVDPLIDLAAPSTLSPYSYSNLNPTSQSDPTGLRADLDGCGAGMCGNQNYGSSSPGSGGLKPSGGGGGGQPKPPKRGVGGGGGGGGGIFDRIKSYGKGLGREATKVSIAFNEHVISPTRTSIAEAFCGEKLKTCKKANPVSLMRSALRALRRGIVSDLLQTDFPGHTGNPDYVVVEATSIGNGFVGGGASLIFTRNGSVFLSPEVALGSIGKSVVARVGYLNSKSVPSGKDIDGFVSGGAVTASVNGPSGLPALAYNVTYSNSGPVSSIEVGATVYSDEYGLSGSLSYAGSVESDSVFKWNS